MANSSAFPTGNTIESAAALFANGSSKPALAIKADLHHAESAAAKERAMARRLEQLHTALGETETAHVSAADLKSAPTTTKKGGSFGATSLFVTGMVSAMFGAGLMWQAIQHQQAPTKPIPELHATATVTLASPTAPEPASVARALETADEQRVGELLKVWRSAWTQRDIAAYLNAYSKDFAPADGNARDTWVAARRKKLSTGGQIDVQIHNLSIERLDEHHFKATFLQDYASGSYREIARPKTLLIAREGGNWRITKEWQE